MNRCFVYLYPALTVGMTQTSLSSSSPESVHVATHHSFLRCSFSLSSFSLSALRFSLSSALALRASSLSFLRRSCAAGSNDSPATRHTHSSTHVQTSSSHNISIDLGFRPSAHEPQANTQKESIRRHIFICGTSGAPAYVKLTHPNYSTHFQDKKIQWSPCASPSAWSSAIPKALRSFLISSSLRAAITCVSLPALWTTNTRSIIHRWSAIFSQLAASLPPHNAQVENG